MSKSSSSSGGVGVLGLLGVVFVALKLTGHISWSWWYVTMPFWGGFALFLTIAIPAVIVFITMEMRKDNKKSKRRI